MAAMLWWPLILALPLPFTRAGPSSSGSLTDHITSVAPKCSHSCIQSFIRDNFPIQVCTSQNFNCLCINPTITGYTLGEAALTCLYADCDGEDSKALALYNICNGIAGAQRNTHPSLTTSFLGSATSDDSSSASSLVPSSSSSVSTESTRTSQSRKSSSTTSFTSTSYHSESTTTLSSSTSSISSTSSTSSTTSITSTTSSTTTTSSSLSTSSSTTESPTLASSSSTSANSANSSATLAPAATSLSKSQIAGVVIASVGVGALAFGFCFFLICYRRRRKRRSRRPSDASWGEKLPQSRDTNTEPEEPISRGIGQQASSPPENRPPLRVLTPSTNGWQNWPRNSNPHGIGLALAPDTHQEPQQQKGGPSPLTPYSQRTHSQLLPDRPHYETLPSTAQHPLNRQSKSLNLPIPAYRPDATPPMNGPKFPSSLDTSQAHLQGLQRSMSDPFYNEPRSPPTDYRGVPYTPYTNPSSRPRSIIRVEDPSSGLRKSNPPTIPENSEIPPLPVAGLARLKGQRHPPRKKSASSSKYTRFSGDSATSFEDIDEEQTPLHSAATPIDSDFVSPTSEDEVPPLPVKSAKRSSHIINRPHPTRSQRKRKEGTPELAVNTQTRDITQTAKWKILVSPGLQSLDESLPTTPRTPLMAGKTPPLPTTDKLPRPTYRMSDFR